MTSKEDRAKILLMQENLAVLRGHAGWTAQRLADEIGVSKQTISNIETGKSSLTKTQYLAMRTVFNFEILERNNVRLAQALHNFVDEPARRKAESLSMEGYEGQNGRKIDGRSGKRVKASDFQTDTMAGLTALTTSMMMNPVGTIVGTYLADSLIGTKTLKNNADAVTKLIVDQVLHAPAEPAQLPYHDGVSPAQQVEHVAELGTVRLRAGRDVGEDPVAARPHERVLLQVDGLAAGADPRVSVNHAHHATNHTTTRQRHGVTEH